MKIVIGCDVDPVLPPILAKVPDGDIWQCLNMIDDLVASFGKNLPPITWLIRSDESVRFSTGNFASGFMAKRLLWQSLMAAGHEFGWHMHLMSFDTRRQCFGFDPDPTWLADACHALGEHFDIHSTRTGWDYASNTMFRRLEELGMVVDFSALPGSLAWCAAGPDKILVDWTRCPSDPYHPCLDDYQRPGNLKLLEIPITQFENSIIGIAKRVSWRLRNGSFLFAGLRNKTRLLTDAWKSLPPAQKPVWAFFFHPEDLQGEGMGRFVENLEQLHTLPDVEFITASAARRFIDGR